MCPGSYRVVVSRDLLRQTDEPWSGLELRDTLLILTSSRVLYGFLFRVPLREDTVADQIAKTGSGALAIDACRVLGSGRWPPNLLLVHHTTCGSQPEQCHPTCPVRKLDAQSGVITSGKVAPHHRRNNTMNPADGGYHGHFGDSQLIGYGDSGGASRFYPQFRSLVECVTWLQTLVATPRV